MNAGKLLIYLGLALVAVGLLVSAAGRLPLRLGRLPGDIIIRGKSTVFYFPLATWLILSVVLTVLFWLLNRR